MGFVKRDVLRWPNGVIPYVLKYNYDPFYTVDPTKGYIKRKPHVRQALQKAFNVYEEATAIRFRPKRFGDKAWVVFSDGTFISRCRSTGGTWNGVGRGNGEQVIFCTADGPRENVDALTRSLIHEIGHIIGLLHEQQRPDRDRFVQVFGLNPITTLGEIFSPQYTKLTGPYDHPVGDFDCFSIMIYNRLTLRKADGPDGCEVIGNRSTLSPLDTASVNFLYPTRRLVRVQENDAQLPAQFLFAGEPFRPYCLWYRSIDGTVTIAEQKRGEEYIVLKEKSVWPKNLSNTLSLSASDKSPIVLHYARQNGSAKMFRVTKQASGSITLQSIWQGTLRRNLTHFAYFPVGDPIANTPLFLAYSSISGEAYIYAVMNSANDIKKTYIDSIWRSREPWSKEWTHVNLFTGFKDRVRVPYLSMYSARTGRVSLSRVHLGFGVTFTPYVLSKTVRTQQGATYTQRDRVIFQSYHHTNHNYIFSLNQKSGMLHVWDTKSGHDWEPVGEIEWTKNWDTFTPYTRIDSAQQVRLWYKLYDSKSGDAEFGRIYASFLPEP